MSKVVTTIQEVPVTCQYPPPADVDKFIEKPGLPRANKAVSRDNPQGSEYSASNRTVLQQHVDFWDRDRDGKIYPWDTYIGFRRLGFNVIISFLAIFVIHGTFSFPTWPSWWPELLFPIYTQRMHRTKHGSDSEVFDTEGRFVPEKFEEIFSKFDKEGKGGLSFQDIGDMVHQNMNVMDPTGWIAERLEWYVFYLLAADENGLITREKIRAQYDGSLFEMIAAEREGRRPFVAGKQTKPHSFPGEGKLE